MRVSQYECNVCMKREEVKDVEAGTPGEFPEPRWVRVEASTIRKDGQSYAISVAHICPKCAPRLDTIGINAEWVSKGVKAQPGDDTRARR